MKEGLFIKKYIKTEDDLPKEEGYYFVHIKSTSGLWDGNDIFEAVDMNDPDTIEYWLNSFDWYLQPVTLEESEIHREAIIFEPPMPDIYDVYDMGFKHGVETIINKLTE